MVLAAATATLARLEKAPDLDVMKGGTVTCFEHLKTLLLILEFKSADLGRSPTKVVLSRKVASTTESEDLTSLTEFLEFTLFFGRRV